MVQKTKQRMVAFNLDDVQMFEEMQRKGQILPSIRFSSFVKSSFYDKLDELQLRHLNEPTKEE